MKRRILLLVATADRSRFWEDIVTGLASRGHQVTLATMSPAGYMNSFCRERGIPSFALELRGRPSYLTASGRVKRLIRQVAPDVVHAHETLPAFAAGLAVLGGSGTPVIYHRHHAHSRWRHRLFAVAAGRMASLTLAVSEAARRRALEEDPGLTGRVAVALNGINALRAPSREEVARERSRLGIGTNQFALTVVGRLRAEKGHEQLIHALGHLPAALRARVHLVFVGSGPEEGRLRTLAEAAQAAVHLVGHQEDVAPWLSLGDLVILPSRHDACPLTALEAMSLGRPIVAFAVGGIPELVQDGVSALLAAAGDEAALAGAISRLLNDRGLQEELGRGARTRFEDGFRLEHMLDRWEAAYEAALRPPGTAPHDSPEPEGRPGWKAVS